MKAILKVFGYILTVLVMAAALIAVVMFVMGIGTGNLSGIIDKVTEGENTILTTMSPVDDATPAPDGSTILEDTQQNGTSSISVGTPSPTPTATPDVTPSPTPVPTPTPEPQPEGMPLGSGTISSDTGKWIDVDAVWNAETIDNSTVKITVVANLRSFGLRTGERREGLVMTVGDDSTTMDVTSISIDSNQEVTTELGSYDFTVKAPAGKITLVPLEVTWKFGGTYSGETLDAVTAKGDISIQR